MIKRFLSPLAIFLSALFLFSCSSEKSIKDRIVIAISSDAESLNPLFSFSFQEVNISELLYAGLVEEEWDKSSGDVVSKPAIAKDWQWNKDSTAVTLNLRNDMKWRDGKPLTAEDVIFSFDLYSDPLVQSRFFGMFTKFYLQDDLHIDIAKTFLSEDPYKLTINFKPKSNPSLVDIDMPVLPKHVFGSLDRKNLASLEKGKDTITSGPFYLAKWDKNRAIVLRRNEKSYLFDPSKPKELVFQVITDYNSKITQLKNGSIDFAENIKPDQVNQLKDNPSLTLSAVKGREYDYAGWNNKNLFSSVNVRKALTYAINRQEILSGFLNGHGEIAAGPVSSIFTTYHNNNIAPYPYSPHKAKELLKSEGWIDKNQNGIIEKNGEEFSFTLNFASGNPRREFAATIIRNNLKAVGIEVKTEPLEPGVFFERMYGHQLNAWLAGWAVPIPLDLTPYWHSDLKKGTFNLTGYSNSEIDILLNKIETTLSKEEKIKYYKRIQEILNNDNPVTFLYWVDNIVGYNALLQNVKITPMGSIHGCREWSFK